MKTISYLVSLVIHDERFPLASGNDLDFLGKDLIIGGLMQEDLRQIQSPSIGLNGKLLDSWDIIILPDNTDPHFLDNGV